MYDNSIFFFKDHRYFRMVGHVINTAFCTAMLIIRSLDEDLMRAGQYGIATVIFKPYLFFITINKNITIINVRFMYIYYNIIYLYYIMIKLQTTIKLY